MLVLVVDLGRALLHGVAQCTMGRGTKALYDVHVLHIDQSRITGIPDADVYGPHHAPFASLRSPPTNAPGLVPLLVCACVCVCGDACVCACACVHDSGWSSRRK